ncbi:unnamed protein product, partial [Mesorhabditis spiculigera]
MQFQQSQITSAPRVPTLERKSRSAIDDPKTDNLLFRVKILEETNNRLLLTQDEIVRDSNRRVQMHVNEIKLLKNEIGMLAAQNKELKEVCCFLDDDRKKSKQLGKEWHKLGKYTSQLMRQEVGTYQRRVEGLEQRENQLVRENEELRQLCLYLDEQRHMWMSNWHEHCERASLRDEEFAESGCGGSEKSSDSSPIEMLKQNNLTVSIDSTKEEALEKLTKLPSPRSRFEMGRKEAETDVLQYIQSLESTMTSSGTTYASWDTDNESPAMPTVDGQGIEDETGRTLTVISEEDDQNMKSMDASSASSHILHFDGLNHRKLGFDNTARGSRDLLTVASHDQHGLNPERSASADSAPRLLQLYKLAPEMEVPPPPKRHSFQGDIVEYRSQV